MENIIYSTALFIAALFWGYFDVVMNICFKLKMELFDKKQTKKLNDKKLNKEEMSTFFENDESFKIASFIKISSFIAMIVATFYIPLEDALIIGSGFFLGRIIPTKNGFFDKIYNSENIAKSSHTSVIYGDIYIAYFTIFLISVIINS